jgi:large subunit ribosomal protein L31
MRPAASRAAVAAHAKENEMKTGIHPETEITTATCRTCGSELALRSTASAFTVDSCSHCHPAYTGRERERATGTRIERFEQRRRLAVAGS